MCSLIPVGVKLLIQKSHGFYALVTITANLVLPNIIPALIMSCVLIDDLSLS